MKPHIRYLRYVLLHKLYVFRAGLMIAGWRPSWVWRLLVHDWSKFRPSEWRPYVANFYGKGKPKRAAGERLQYAWLSHVHRNAHHWQHWVLHEDSGKTIVQLMPSQVADEMLADWIGAGTKILTLPTMAECIAETVLWYGENYQRMMLRGVVRAHVEMRLVDLSERYLALPDRPPMPDSQPVDLTFMRP